MSGNVLTANRVSDGTVVFLTEAQTWSEWVNDAFVAVEAAGIEQLESIAGEAARGTGVTDVYLFDAERHGDEVRPAHIRDRIRALGPTIRSDLGKQAAGIGGAFEAAL